MHVFRDSPTESCPQGVEFDVGLHYGAGGYEYGPETSILSAIDYWMTESEWVGMDDCFDRICLADPDTGVKKGEYGTTRTIRNRWPVFLKECAKMSPETVEKDKSAAGKLQKLEMQVMNSRSVSTFKILPMFLVNWLKFLPFLVNKFTGNADDWSSRSTKDILDSIDCSDAFKFLYGYSWGNIGVPPHRSAFLRHSSMTMGYCLGAGYPIGGCIPMVNRMLHKIFANKSQAFTNARVAQIILKNGEHVVGVEVKAGTSKDLITIDCESVISTAGFPNTFRSLLNNQINIEKHPQYKLAKTYEKSKEGCFISFITLKKMDLPKKNYWMFTDVDHERSFNKFMDSESPDDQNCPQMFVSFPSAKDPTFNESDRFPNTATCEIFVNKIPMRWFEGIDYKSDEYKNFKQRIAEKLWDQVVEYFSKDEPEFAKALDQNCENISGGSPFTFDNFINSVNGQVYGLDHSMDRYGVDSSVLLRPECIGIKGLHFSGQDVANVGMFGAQQSGILTASAILGRNLMPDFVDFMIGLKVAKSKQQKND